MNKINLFGSTGFIGSKFSYLYKDEIISNPRDDYKIKSNNVLYMISTVDNYNIHNDLQIDVDTNLKILLTVLDKAKNNKDLIFNFVSSWFVYGQTNELPFHEETTVCKPTGFYSITKYCAEQLITCFCNTFGIKYRIFRLSNVLGEGDKKISRKKNALQFLIKEAVNNNDLHLYYSGEVLRDYIYVDDACRAIKLCMETSPTNQIINIGSGRPYRFLDIIEKAIDKSDSKSRIINIEPTLFHNIVQTKHSYLNTQKLKSYGFKEEFNMDSIIDKLVNFYKEEK